MGNFVLIILAVMVVLSVSLLLASIFRFELSRKVRIKINEEKLHDRLMKIVEFEKINVIYRHQYELRNADTGEDLVSRMSYSCNKRTGLLDDAQETIIFITHLYRYDPWVLAKCIGSYYAIRDYGNATEELSQREAKKIVLKLLSYTEKLSLAIHIKVYLEDVK